MEHLERINLVLEQMEVEQMSLDRIGLLLVEMPEQEVLLLLQKEHGVNGLEVVLVEQSQQEVLDLV